MMRVLIVYENRHRSYGEALEGAVRRLRPGLEVLLVQARQLVGEIGRFDPHLVVSDKQNTVDPGGRAAWVRLSEEPEEPSEVCVGGERREMDNPGIEELLAVLDETEKSVLTGVEELGGC
jgi:hypothetical protein